MGSTPWLAMMLAALVLLMGQLVGASAIPKYLEAKRITPKVMIVSMVGGKPARRLRLY